MKNFQESDFKVEIPNFSKDSSSSTTVFYDIIVAFQEKKWKLIKRYSEFEELHNRLNKVILNMPYLPAKSLFKLTGVEIEKRRLDLEKYIRALSLRKDIVQLPDFLNFLEFENYTTNEIFSPKEIGTLANLPLSVSDFVFIKEVGILFVSLTDTSILSKMDDIFSTFTNKLPNESRGSVLAYKLEGNTSLKFQQLWKKDFKNGTTCLYWDEALTFLAVGFDDGSCECIRVSTEHNYQEFDEFCIVKRHTAKVTGCGFYSLLATLYTISKDKTLVVTDITKTVNFALEEKTFLNELTCLFVDNPNKRMFIADNTGNIHIYGLDIPLQFFHKIPCEYPQNFSTLAMDIKKRFLLAGSVQGMIYIYELGRPGKEKLISMTSKIEASKNLKTIAFSILDKNLYFNFGNTVIFMDSTRALPYFSLDKHKSDVVKIILLDSEKVLITASKDKSIKFWKLKDKDEEDSEKSKEKSKFEEKTENTVKFNENEKEKTALKEEKKFNPLKDREIKQSKEDNNVLKKIDEIPKNIPKKVELDFKKLEEFPKNHQLKDPLMKSFSLNPMEKGNPEPVPVKTEPVSNKNKPLFETDDENELMGWHDDSKVAPIEKSINSIQQAIEKTVTDKPKFNAKHTLMYEEDHNDLCGWENPKEEISYLPRKNPLLEVKSVAVQKSQPFSHSKSSGVGVNNETKESNIGTKPVKKNKFEDEDELTGWNQ